MSLHDPLAALKEIRLEDMQDRNWILFSRHVSPILYDAIQRLASEKKVGARDTQHVTSAEEASQLVVEHNGLAFLTRTGAWRIAQDGVTMRPLAEERLRLLTNFVVRSDSESRLINEFVRAAARKLSNTKQMIQGQLPLTG